MLSVVHYRIIDGLIQCMDSCSPDMELILSMATGKLNFGLELLEFRLCFIEGLLKVLQHILMRSNKFFQSTETFLLSLCRLLHMSKCSCRYPF